MNLKDQIFHLYSSYKERRLRHRFICNYHIESLVKNLPSEFDVKQIGTSVNQLPIYSITFGSGSKKILMWSQMHGNESTTTKAIFDVFNAAKDNFLMDLLKSVQICVIPILNPDGAELYTRENANGIDLNRDAQNQSQPESKALRRVFDEFKPDYCYNLHGQRTIFSAGRNNSPATLSFLAPAQDFDRTITKTRITAMAIIGEMNSMLQQIIPNQVGIYDDGFNLNCVGDTFQSLGIPTILFEAGHYKNDYSREKVRQFIFIALMTSIHYIAKNESSEKKYKDYFKIPKNHKLFYDIIIRNAVLIKDQTTKDIGIKYLEVLENGKIVFKPKIATIKNLKNYFAHKDIDADKNLVLSKDLKKLSKGYSNDFVYINNEKFSLKLKES